MPSRRLRRAKLAVLCLAPAAALVITVFVVRDWHVVLAHYHAWRLERAETYDDALPSLLAIAGDISKPGTSGAVLGKIGPSHSRLSFWVFTAVERGVFMDEALLADLGRRVRQDEVVLAWWSHYVRWAHGTAVWSFLPPIDAQEPEEDIAFPCGDLASPRNAQRQAAGAPPPRPLSVPGGGTSLTGLRVLGLAWFLGMWPLPEPGRDPREQLADWWTRLKPFYRHLAHDPKLGRCKRDTEFEPLPTLGFKELSAPAIPLPGWTDAVPRLPPTTTSGVGDK